jgi:diguanylate cyclase (GGDEF)-like protein
MTDQRDHLTQLLIRAEFDAALSLHFSEATAEQPASLIMADIDRFKKINDNYGHQMGDAILK